MIGEATHLECTAKTCEASHRNTRFSFVKRSKQSDFMACGNLGRFDLAHVEAGDLSPDAVGRGNEEGNLKRHADDETLAAVKRLTSTGYVRGNNLYVLHGGAALAEAEEPVAAQASAAHALTGTGPAVAVAVGAAVATESVNAKLDRIREARMLGFEGDACDECGNFTLVRNGTCLKCNTCGATSGCS